MVCDCKYNIANEAYENMDYYKAYELFSELAEYKDSTELGKQAGYALGNLYAANDNYVAAHDIFMELGDYKESKNLVSKCEDLLLENASVGDIIYYGSYEQDGDESNGKEPLQWLVLATDEGSILVLSEYILEVRRFDEGNSHYWEESSLREWLNNDFLNDSFTESEQSCIQLMITSETTNDYVFCLSAEEARGLFSSDDDRRACPTEAAIINGFDVWDDCGDWWTRSISTAKNGKGVVPVEADGNVRSAGTAANSPNQYSTGCDIGPRPAMCICVNTDTVSEAQNMSRFGFDSNTDLDHEPNLWKEKSHSSKGSSNGKCVICNGTGHVRYYYGSSDFEAWLTGHDAYTVGTCTSCGGTGKAW